MRVARRLFHVSHGILLATTLSLAGCGGGGASGDSAASVSAQSPVSARSPAPPAAPAPAPLPTPSTSSATLDWVAPTENTDGSALSDLAGFKIRYGTDAGQLSSGITLTSAGLLTYVVEGLPMGATYYFAVTAMTTAGIESAQSSVVSKLIT